jgi:hypothetical protein
MSNRLSYDRAPSFLSNVKSDSCVSHPMVRKQLGGPGYFVDGPPVTATRGEKGKPVEIAWAGRPEGAPGTE